MIKCSWSPLDKQRFCVLDICSLFRLIRKLCLLSILSGPWKPYGSILVQGEWTPPWSGRRSKTSWLRPSSRMFPVKSFTEHRTASFPSWWSSEVVGSNLKMYFLLLPGQNRMFSVCWRSTFGRRTAATSSSALTSCWMRISNPGFWKSTYRRGETHTHTHTRAQQRSQTESVPTLFLQPPLQHGAGCFHQRSDGQRPPQPGWLPSAPKRRCAGLEQQQQQQRLQLR